MSLKKKVLIVISGNEYIRNYIQSDALASIENNFDCFYVGSDRITLQEELKGKKNFLGYYPENLKQNQKAYNYFNVLMYKHQSICSSFVFRTMRTYNLRNDNFFNNVKEIVAQSFNLKFTLLRKYLSIAKVKVLSSGIIFKAYQRNFLGSYRKNPFLHEVVKSIVPDIVLFPSSAYDPIGVDIVRLARDYNIPSFFLIDNWDNLSSKSILFEKPYYLGVWSQQSLEHAVEIQKFNKSNIRILGTPRFNQYFKTRDIKLDSYFPFPYILFVGTAVAFDEAGILIKINQIISENQDTFKGVKLIYRPHPWRQGSDSIADMDLPHIIIDPQLKDSYLKRDSTSSVQPNLSYYPALIKNAEFVMGGLTSMLIESLIFRKYYLALAYDDGVNLTSQHNVLKYYVHFKGLENVDSVNIIHDLENFADTFKEHWNNRNNIDKGNVDLQREYFLSQDEQCEYRDKLNLVVQEILTNYVS